MNNWITIHFASGGLQYFGIQSHRQSEHIDSPHHRCFGSLNRIMLVMNGWRRTSQIVNFIHFGRIRISNVLSYNFKMMISHQMLYIVLRTCKEVIQTYNVVSLIYKSSTKMRAYKSSPATYQYSFHLLILTIVFQRRELPRLVYRGKCKRFAHNIQF